MFKLDYEVWMEKKKMKYGWGVGSFNMNNGVGGHGHLG